ncbi:trypsin [Herbihabitans rhizosphaerae]|uniref:Trypsin n=1 Tax=Herbihabitans rhizosphaerae TaxID=1872711 RepID=A0A4V2ETJ3_9PSEU|nr:DUF1986 domain-containing protein [Herbihabitans rhizosphaerae]RZS41273.1 trypsin [Herbihabitans rhizosphaerae]
MAIRRTCAVAAIAVSAVLVSAPSAGAIEGGEIVKEGAPWNAQIVWESRGLQCSGSIVSAEWVLTAKHCLPDDGTALSVWIGGLKQGEGQAAKVDRTEVPDKADIALLHLDRKIDASYVKLADSDPAIGSEDTIYGWGLTGPNTKPSDVLKKATVRVEKVGGDCLDAYGGSSVCVVGVTGYARSCDSGGPMISGGVQVGVLSTGDDKRDQYSSVAVNRPWITKITGV